MPYVPETFVDEYPSPGTVDQARTVQPNLLRGGFQKTRTLNVLVEGDLPAKLEILNELWYA